MPNPKPPGENVAAGGAGSATVAVSVVIPAYNERSGIVATLERICHYAAGDAPTARLGAWELIVVDDGSADDTAERVRAFARDRSTADSGSGATDADSGSGGTNALTVGLLADTPHRGKGHAVRRGMLAARGHWRLMCDADLSAPIEELDTLLAAARKGAEVVIGSRDLPASRLEPPQSLFRRALARVFRAVRRMILLPELRDTQCGFKLFGAEAASEIFARVQTEGWLFDCEALGVAQRLGYRIAEVGICWRNRKQSRVRPLREAFSSIPALIRIRRRLGRIRAGK